jgi:hypothetical protein
MRDISDFVQWDVSFQNIVAQRSALSSFVIIKHEIVVFRFFFSSFRSVPGVSSVSDHCAGLTLFHQRFHEILI